MLGGDQRSPRSPGLGLASWHGGRHTGCVVSLYHTSSIIIRDELLGLLAHQQFWNPIPLIL